MSKYLYVAFIKTNTKVGAIIRKVTGWKYSHISVTFDPKEGKYFAFATQHHQSSLIAGFNVDYKSNYTLMKNKPAEITYYRIPITKDEYKKICDFIEETRTDKEYIFNYLSMVTTTIFHGFEVYKSLNCITFVSMILSFIHVIKLSKKYYKYDLNELEEEVKDFYYKKESFVVDKIEEGNKYYDHIPFWTIKKGEINMIRECFYRLFHKKSSKRYREK